MAQTKDYLTIAETAGLLRIAERTLYRLAREEKVPVMKVGDQWRFSRAALDVWSRKGSEAPVHPTKKSRRKR
jgi:excisionase family DNA binding protein